MTLMVRDARATLATLRDVPRRLPSLGRAELASLLAPAIEILSTRLEASDRVHVSDWALQFCRDLYSGARSGDALPLARAVLGQATLARDAPLERRAATVCGLLAADAADVVEAVEHYVRALRLLGPEDRVEASGIWNNIGLAMAIAGNAEMAGRCYERAIALVDGFDSPLYARFAACGNLAHSSFQLGAIAEGLRFGERALQEGVENFLPRDPLSVQLLHRNMVRLLVAAGRVSEAEEHVARTVALAELLASPRARIAAATARAVHELAVGRSDVGLTRLEQALSQAREVPAALRETLACVIAAEEASGHSERALLRLAELSDLVYRSAIERAKAHAELAALRPGASGHFDRSSEQARARLVSKVAPARRPEGWAMIERRAVSAVMRMDPTGWHGKRVGAFSKALAMAAGVDPLQALEIGLAAEVHDIGMACVPAEILAKRSPLCSAEEAILQRHVEAGAEMLVDDSHPRMFLAHEIVRYHHARWDGQGYPRHVGGRFIPLPARICAIADAYDSMVSGLDRQAPRTMDEALAELSREAGRQFDPELVASFDGLVRTETEELGVDLASGGAMEGFQELVNALQEDRGFV